MGLMVIVTVMKIIVVGMMTRFYTMKVKYFGNGVAVIMILLTMLLISFRLHMIVKTNKVNNSGTDLNSAWKFPNHKV